jgi:Wax ester synthase/diacylglycerol acyltransferase catalytic domain
MAEFMRSSDAFSWSMERDPGLRSTIVTLVLLDRSPDWGQIVERFDRLCRTLPMFRQKVVESPAPAPPRWELDPDFDLGFHMRRVTAPEPGTVGAAVGQSVDQCGFPQRPRAIEVRHRREPGHLQHGVGINVDTGAIPDYDVFYDCLVEGFEEVLALAD